MKIIATFNSPPKYKWEKGILYYYSCPDDGGKTIVLCTKDSNNTQLEGVMIYTSYPYAQGETDCIGSSSDSWCNQFRQFYGTLKIVQ